MKSEFSLTGKVRPTWHTCMRVLIGFRYEADIHVPDECELVSYSADGPVIRICCSPNIHGNAEVDVPFARRKP